MKKNRKVTSEVTSDEFMNYFWKLSRKVTNKELTPTSVNAACNAGRNVLKMAFLKEKLARSKHSSSNIVL